MNMGSPDKHQTGKNHHLIQAMGHAIDGITQVLREERNMRYHVAAAIITIVVAVLLRITVMEWLWILLAIFMVFTAEFLNTVTEAITDLIAGHHYELNVKRAKDVAAGGVLIAALFAVLVGLIIFVPRLVAIIR